jgi:hypothetical protein
MSLFILKILIGSAFVASSLTAFVSMMSLMGRPPRPEGPPPGLRKIHRTAGYSAVILLIPLVVIGAKFWVGGGDTLSFRAGFHVLLALALVFLLTLKILIVRYYKSYLKMAPTLGMAVTVCALLVFMLSAGYIGLTKIF